jgi:3D (Asp-Asp-Asp) domain-containing protein
MAQSKTTGMALGVPDQVWRSPRLAFETKGVVDGRAHRSTNRSSSRSKSALRAIYFLVLLLIAVCVPIVGRSVHVPEGVKHASSGGLGAKASSTSDNGRLQPSIIDSSRLRSLLADRSVSANFVPALHEALVSENRGPVDSLRGMARPPLGSFAARPLQDSDSLGWFLEGSTRAAGESRLARLTTYWPEEGDYYTKRGLSSTGVRLRDGHCAVDPKVIPYGSVVAIPGVGEFVAVDTGPAVVSRRAARQFGRNPDERGALVIDVYCSSRSKANAFEASTPEFAVITWSR